MHDPTAKLPDARTWSAADLAAARQPARAPDPAAPTPAADDIDRLKAELLDLRLHDRQRQAAVVEVAEERDRLRREVADREDELKAVKGSTVWRVLGPLHAFSARFPWLARRVLRGTQLIVWTVTFQLHRRLPKLLAERREALEQTARRQADAAAQGPAEPASVPVRANPPLVADLLNQRFSALRPFPIYRVAGLPRRITLVTDSINAGSLYGGVATAIILAAELAKATDRKLRVLTRTESPHQDNLQDVLKNANVDCEGSIEFVRSSPTVPREVDVGDGDTFLTTSWWTTHACRKVVSSDRIVYLLQEDERDFYPAGDDRLRCADVFRDEHIRFVINTKLLRDHLVAEGYDNIGRNGCWFDPAFPLSTYYPEPSSGAKMNFFFYARPHNVRNLFYRGIEAIDEAVQQGVLDPNAWQFHFVGKDLDPELANLPFHPTLAQNLAWSDYTALVRRMDLGLSLMYTPHPSYPPLDLAASGSVVVTNRYGLKQDLSAYSNNIICADSDVASLVQAIGAGVALARDKERRAANYRNSTIGRDWSASLQGVVAALSKQPCS